MEKLATSDQFPIWDNEQMNFYDWLLAVDDYFKVHASWPRSYTEETGFNCWWESFRSGMSPEEAATEEISYWSV